jgi:hypothetical protein
MQCVLAFVLYFSGQHFPVDILLCRYVLPALPSIRSYMKVTESESIESLNTCVFSTTTTSLLVSDNVGLIKDHHSILIPLWSHLVIINPPLEYPRFLQQHHRHHHQSNLQ